MRNILSPLGTGLCGAGNSRKKCGVLHIRTLETLIYCVFKVENAPPGLCAPQRAVIFLSQQMIEFLMCAALKSGFSLYAKKQRSRNVREVVFPREHYATFVFPYKDWNNHSFQSAYIRNSSFAAEISRSLWGVQSRRRVFKFKDTTLIPKCEYEKLSHFLLNEFPAPQARFPRGDKIFLINDITFRSPCLTDGWHYLITYSVSA